MRLLDLLRVAACSLCLFSPALAQTEYFTNGRPVVGLSGSRASADGQSAFGFGLEAMVSPKAGAAISFSRSTVEAGSREFEVNVVSVGVQAFPARQGSDGAVTLGVAFGLGFLNGNDTSAKTINVGVQAAHVIGGAKPGIQLVPKAELALVLALAETTAAASQALGVGLGVALRAAPAFVIFLEPNASISFGSGDSQTFLGGTFGIGFSL